MNVTGLNKLATEIYEANKAKGFWDKERNTGEMLMLITSELGEAMEACRKNRYVDYKSYDKLIEEGYNWEINSELLKEKVEDKIKDTFSDEVIDAMIRIFDMCGGMGIDIEKAMSIKLAYNKTRERLHGKTF
jgi:NTP pyrophosphatase (non-canonical NTP hydrolase)